MAAKSYREIWGHEDHAYYPPRWVWEVTYFDGNIARTRRILMMSKYEWPFRIKRVLCLRYGLDESKIESVIAECIGHVDDQEEDNDGN